MKTMQTANRMDAAKKPRHLHAPPVVLGLALLALGNLRCDTGAPGGGPLGAPGNVVVQVSWSGIGNLDIGATTPDGFVAANYFEDDANDQCRHGGDEQGVDGGGHFERFSCGVEPGDHWVIVVDNFSDTDLSYTVGLEVVGGGALPGYPQTRTITAGNNQVDIRNGGERHSITF
ncbi:MAG: hypothetical protein KJO98_10895 [Rhodothermia bacterium]|nr:hypothetical protein [Rhodothermia bacterium]